MHIGQAIKEELDRQDITVVRLAKELSYTRTNIYKIFEKSSIDTELLYRISIILKLDFFKLYSNRIHENDK